LTLMERVSAQARVELESEKHTLGERDYKEKQAKVAAGGREFVSHIAFLHRLLDEERDREREREERQMALLAPLMRKEQLKLDKVEVDIAHKYHKEEAKWHKAEVKMHKEDLKLHKKDVKEAYHDSKVEDKILEKHAKVGNRILEKRAKLEHKIFEQDIQDMKRTEQDSHPDEAQNGIDLVGSDELKRSAGPHVICKEDKEGKHEKHKHKHKDKHEHEHNKHDRHDDDTHIKAKKERHGDDKHNDGEKHKKNEIHKYGEDNEHNKDKKDKMQEI